MAQKSLFRLISSLSKQEFGKFREFISSPFFNKRSDIARFIEYLEPHFPEFPENTLTDELIYSSVYGAGGTNGSGKFNMQVVKNLLNRTLNLCEKFLVQLGVEKDEFLQSLALTGELHSKGLSARALKTAYEKIEYFNKTGVYSADRMKKQYELLQLSHSLIHADNTKQKILNNNKRYSAALKYFIISMMGIASDYEVYSFVETVPVKNVYIEKITEYIDFEKILGLIKENEPEEYSIAACYFYGLMSKINDPNGEYREKLKQLSSANIENFRHTDNIELWQMIFSSYIFSRFQKGPVDVKQLHEINKMYVDKGITQKDDKGYIDENNYHNITMQAIASSDYKWTENFINRYKDELNPEIKDNTYNFLMGYYKLMKGEYNDVIPYLSRIKTGDIPVNLTIRWMYIRAYYELGYYFEAESAVEACKKFISSSGRVTKESRSSYPQLLFYTGHMIKAKTSGKRLKEEIYLKAKNTPSFMAKKWVMEKMEELVK